MWNVFAILALMLVACGRGANDSQFDAYVSAFKSAASKYDPAHSQFEISISFADPHSLDHDGTNVFGKCSSGIFGDSIQIDSETWRTDTESEKEMLVFHELGHCILHRIHDSSTIQEVAWQAPRPLSLMFPGGIAISQYEKHRETYLKELFDGH